MMFAVYWSALAVISSVGAAKVDGDDDWVHLPNRCEGKSEAQQLLGSL